jgi:ADP-ribosyl-[dinitrogen reductase] hydrolase
MTAEEATAHVAERWLHLGLWSAEFTTALEGVRRKSR